MWNPIILQLVIYYCWLLLLLLLLRWNGWLLWIFNDTKSFVAAFSKRGPYKCCGKINFMLPLFGSLLVVARCQQLSLRWTRTLNSYELFMTAHFIVSAEKMRHRRHNNMDLFRFLSEKEYTNNKNGNYTHMLLATDKWSWTSSKPNVLSTHIKGSIYTSWLLFLTQVKPVD
jgi:hypothetical protein